LATWPASGISSRPRLRHARRERARERTVDPVALAAEDEQRRFERRDLAADVEARSSPHRPRELAAGQRQGVLQRAQRTRKRPR
jgi:hypothetical protein